MASGLSATSRVYRNFVTIEEIPDLAEKPTTPEELEALSIEDEVDFYHSISLLLAEGITISCEGGPLYLTPVHILAREARKRYRTQEPMAA